MFNYAQAHLLSKKHDRTHWQSPNADKGAQTGKGGEHIPNNNSDLNRTYYWVSRVPFVEARVHLFITTIFHTCKRKVCCRKAIEINFYLAAHYPLSWR